MTSGNNNQSAEKNSFFVAHEFPLVYRFLIAGLVTILVTSCVLIFLYRQDQLAEHEQISAQLNEQAAAQLVHSLGKQINALVLSGAGLDTRALRHNPNIDLLPSAQEILSNFNILKLKIYNPSGTTIYSSAREEIGETGRHSDLLVAKALRGETTHRVEFRGTFLGASGEMRDIYVALSYMPFVYEGQLIGTLEIYRDATPVFSHLKANSIRIPEIILGGFAMLYAALFFYMRRTDRAVAEWHKASLESENRLRRLEQQKLVQTSLDGFFVVRVNDARIIEVNDAFCGMLGYGREELLGMCISDLEVNESRAETAAHIKKIVEIGYDRFETRHRHKQGQSVDLEVNVSRSGLDDGTILVFTRDITATRSSERRVANFFANVPGFVFTLRMPQQGPFSFPFVSAGIEKLYGLKPEEVKDDMEPLHALTHPEDRTHIERSLDAAKRTLKPFQVEFRMQRPGWPLRWIECRSVGVRGAGGSIFWHGIMLDITERKQAEAMLMQRERELRTLAENLPDNIVRYNRDGVTVYVNPVLERTLGDSAAAMIGTTPREYHSNDSYDDYAQLLDAVLASGEAGEIEKILPTPVGETSVHQIRMVPERDKSGAVVGVLAIGRDISKLKHMEKERLDHLRFLENMDRINRAIQGTNDLQQMMRDVLDVVLVIFDCDRAFLAYPCDPDVVEFRVPMERTKPEYPGALALGVPVPMGKEMKDLFRTVLGVAGAVKLGPGAGYPLPAFLSEQYDVKSEMVMALHPKQDKPWQFGLHQCAHSRVWSEADARLLQEIGRRLTDALTSLLMYHNLQASEQKFRSLAENMPDALIRYDREGRRTYINPALKRIFAVRDEQVIGKTMQEARLASTPEAYQRALEHTLATGKTSEFEMQLPAPMGEVRTGIVLITAERTADGQISGAITIAHDITERKRAERELLMLNRALDHAFDATYLLDSDLRFRYVNEAAVHALGYSREELLLMSVLDIDPNITREAIQDLMRQTIDGGYLGIVESRHRRKNGETFPIEVGATTFAYGDEMLFLTIVRDISGRKQMEAELMHWEAELRSVTDSSPYSIIRYDLDGRITYANAPLLGYFGISLAEVVGLRPCEVWPDGRYAAIEQGIAQVLETEAGMIVEISETTAVGEVAYHQIWIVPARGAAGEMNGVVAFGLDISDRKRLEEALRAREREYRTLAENSPDSIYRYDRDHRRLYVNPTVCKIVGKSAEELIGGTPADGAILVSEQSRMVMDRIDRVFDSGETESFIVNFVEQDGEPNDYHMLIVPEHDADGRVATVLGFTRNVTEIRQLERRQSLFFAMAPGLFVTLLKHADGSYEMPFVSEGIRELYGIEPEAAMQDISAFAAIAHPEDIEMTFRKADESARDLTPYKVEYRINHPCKGVRWIECNSMPQRLPDGGTRWQGFYQDITERKQAEQLIEESRAQLRGLIAKNETVREEERKRIARELHDELGQVLTSLRLNVFMLTNKFGRDLPALRESISSMLELVDKSQAVARNVATALRTAAFDMGIVSGIEWVMKQFVQNTGIDCEMHVREQDRNIYLEEDSCTALFRIAQESLTNIMRHAQASKVDITLMQDEGVILLEVRDNGIGFDQAAAKAGSFGLIGIRERVYMLGGEFSINSTPGSGTVIEVRIPG